MGVDSSIYVMNRELYRRITRVFREHGVRCRFERRYGPCLAHMDRNLVQIRVGKRCDVNLMSACMHELAHILNCRDRKYARYHRYSDIPKGVVREIGLRAERYTDRVAKGLAEKYFPDMRFVPVYGTEGAARWYKEYMGVGK